MPFIINCYECDRPVRQVDSEFYFRSNRPPLYCSDYCRDKNIRKTAFMARAVPSPFDPSGWEISPYPLAGYKDNYVDPLSYPFKGEYAFKQLCHIELIGIDGQGRICKDTAIYGNLVVVEAHILYQSELAETNVEDIRIAANLLDGTWRFISASQPAGAMILDPSKLKLDERDLQQIIAKTKLLVL